MLSGKAYLARAVNSWLGLWSPVRLNNVKAALEILGLNSSFYLEDKEEET